MPQLDFASFISQIVWFFVIFFGFYILIASRVVPQMSSILKTRNKLLIRSEESTKGESSISSVISSIYSDTPCFNNPTVTPSKKIIMSLSRFFSHV